jgi:hypothetical protein
MTNQAAIESDEIQAQRVRFMRLALPVRLGELAESLALATFAPDHPKYPKFLTREINKSVNFIDWMVAAVDPEVQSELAELRSHLTDWLRDAQVIGDDPVKRARMVAALREWSQKILNRSGLADYEDWQVEFDYPPGIRAAAEVRV